MRRTGGVTYLGARKTLSFPFSLSLSFPYPFPFPFPYPFPFFQRVEDLPFWEVFALQGISSSFTELPSTKIPTLPLGFRGCGISTVRSQYGEASWRTSSK
jgi:hypothetical protein